MSTDPFQAREAEKYSNPIPSREFILTHLDKRQKPASRDELAYELGVKTEEQLEALRRRLRAMERDGQLIFTRRQRYVLPERLDLVRGNVIGNRSGYGFLRVEGEKEDYYLSSEQMRLCMHGDSILAQPLGIDRKGRREARLVRVLEARNNQIVGRFFTDAGVGYVVPDDNRLSFDILIPADESMHARMGSVVVVELVRRATRQSKAIGKVIEVLGENMGTDMAVEMALRTHDIPHQWPEAVLAQIATIDEQVPESAKVGRKDLRAMPLVTIDGEDARDFDDAVYCEKKRGGGWRLWVAIADVSYYVRPNTPLDDEARQRATSVYFPSQVVPMLPEVLSNGLCSLNPQVDRLCLVCEMTVSTSGKLTSFKHYEAVMNSHARLTYNQVWAMLQDDSALQRQYAPVTKPLQELHRLYQALEKAREERGGIAFETEEPLFIFNAERRIERVECIRRNDAHRIIEECMILANIAAARCVEKNQEPALFRNHDKPTDEAIGAFRKTLGELGLTLGSGSKPTPLDYANLLLQLRDRPDHEMLQTMLLRSMKQAVYDAENRGHFGLALNAYAHFTSPIRRYPDLLLHRSIKSILAKAQQPSGQALMPTGGHHYTLEQMLQLGQHCSLCERRADEATREVADWLKCDFMRDHVGSTFDGTIVSITAFGFFVRLNDLFIDGLVHVSSLDNDYYRFDVVGQRLTGESSGLMYRLGDSVTVRVEAVNRDERKIDLTLIMSQRKPRRPGKTERKKSGAKQSTAARVGRALADRAAKKQDAVSNSKKGKKTEQVAAKQTKNQRPPRRVKAKK